MQEMEELKDNIEVEEETVRKEKKFTSGLSGEAKVKPFLLPVWSIKENKKIDIDDIKTVEITEDVILLQNIIKKSEEIRATYED